MDGQIDRAAIELQVKVIKEKMPETYKLIQGKAQTMGREAYAMVRRSLAGTPNQFWAMEGGRVMGTPFESTEPIAAGVALVLVNFGSSFVVVFAEPTAGQGASDHAAD